MIVLLIYIGLFFFAGFISLFFVLMEGIIFEKYGGVFFLVTWLSVFVLFVLLRTGIIK